MTRLTFIVLALTTILLTACGAASTPVPPTETATPLPTATFTPSLTPEPTATSAPTETPPSTNTAAAISVSFANDVMPILQSRCFNCHGGEQTKEGLSVASYETLMAGSVNGPVVIPGDPNNSLLVQLLLNGKMPKRGPKLTPAQIQIIIDWVLGGALNN